MLTFFICGSFHNQEQEGQDMDIWSPPSTLPRRSSKKNTCCKSKDSSKNPYADRGLDKFSALLSDLDDKRRKIYSQKGAQDISFVRFVYTDPNDCKPIIVKVKDNRKLHKAAVDVSKDNLNIHTSEVPDKSSVQEVGESKFESSDKTQKRMSFKWNMKMVDWRKPSYYLPVFIIFILLFLAIFGRSFAIMCTSIGWYLIPTINGGGVNTTSNLKKPKKKKEYLRRSSDVKIASSESISSPKSVLTGMNDASPQHHGQKKSW